MSKYNGLTPDLPTGVQETVTLSDGSVLVLKRLETVGEASLPAAIYRRLRVKIAEIAKRSEDRMMEIYAEDGVTLYTYVDAICRLVSIDTDRKFFSWQSPDEYLVTGFKTWLAFKPADLEVITAATSRLAAAPVPAHKLGGTDIASAEGEEKKD